MSSIRAYKSEEAGYQNLKKVAELMTRDSKNGVKYDVSDVYFDFGQDWMWTTIVAEKVAVREADGKRFNESWQCLYPRVHEAIVNATSEFEILVCTDEAEKENNGLDTYEKH